MQPFDGEECSRWEAFDAALRRFGRPLPGEEPDPGLRARCLPPGTGEPPRSVRAYRILTVDDEPNIRRLIQFYLSRAGYEVALAEDGIQALEAVQNVEPDVVILDVMMPGLDGFEVLRLLKSDPGTAHIPVVMLTARSDDDNIRFGWRGGVDFYMGKPFNPRELQTVVDRMTASLGDPDAPPPLRSWLK